MTTHTPRQAALERVLTAGKSWVEAVERSNSFPGTLEGLRQALDDPSTDFSLEPLYAAILIALAAVEQAAPEEETPMDYAPPLVSQAAPEGIEIRERTIYDLGVKLADARVALREAVELLRGSDIDTYRHDMFQHWLALPAVVAALKEGK